MEEYQNSLLEALLPVSSALRFNGHAFFMLCEELMKINTDVESITLKQLAEASERSRLKYEERIK